MQFDQLRRREFITLLGGAVIAWPLAARAQQQLPVIGILSSRSRATDALLIAVIRQGLNDAGFIEGLPQAFLEFMQGGP